MTNIKPALTVEQWADGYANGDLSVEPHVGEYPARLHVYILDACDSGEGTTSDAGHELTSPERHALAALALYGQPFGFTQRDVGALMDAICPLGANAEYDYEELASRIAALLPPLP